MSDKRLKMAKLFTAINIIVIIILSACLFYGAHIKDYDDMSINGIDNKKNLYELLKVMYFSKDCDYTNASLTILNQQNAKYENYSMVTSVDIVKPKYFMIGESKLTVIINARVDKDAAIGFIDIESDDKVVAKYKYYRTCNDNVMKTYLLVDNVWYVTKETETCIALDLNKIINKLKNSDFERYPKKKYENKMATLYPKDDNIYSVEICDCGMIETISLKNCDYETIGDRIGKSLPAKYDEQVENISDWMEANKYNCKVTYDIKDVGKVNVNIPKDMDMICTEGDIYEIIMTSISNCIVNKDE